MLLGAKRFAEDKVLDGHAGKGRQSFDLTMLFRVDFDRKSVHTLKVDNFYHIVNQTKLRQRAGRCGPAAPSLHRKNDRTANEHEKEDRGSWIADGRNRRFFLISALTPLRSVHAK